MSIMPLPAVLAAVVQKGASNDRVGFLRLILGVFALCFAMIAAAQAWASDSFRPTRFLGGGQYALYSGGSEVDVASRSMAGTTFEVELLTPLSSASWSVLSSQNFDLESRTMVQFFIAAGYSLYVFDPVRPARVSGQTYSFEQSPVWNTRLQIFSGFGRQVLQSFLRFGELEAATETAEAGICLVPLWHLTPNVSFWSRFEFRYTFGIGKYDLAGQTVSAALGAEWGL